MDRFTGLLLFTRIVEAGSLSAAARDSGVSQPTMSKQLSDLEARLGAQLLQRTTRQVSLTEAGAAFYTRAKRILSELEQAEAAAAELHGSPRGTLRVGSPVAFGQLFLVPTLPSFLRRYPGLSIDLSMSDRFINLVEDGADVVIRIGTLPDMSLIARHLGRSPRVAVASPGYLASKREPLVPKDLQRHDCLAYTLAAGNEWQFTGPVTVGAVQVSGPFQADSYQAILQAALDGLGIALLPAWLVAGPLAAGSLVTVMPGWKPVPMDISVLYAPGGRVASKVRLFVDHVVSVFRSARLLAPEP